MRQDGFPYLNTAQLILTNRANNIPGKQLLTVCEFNGRISAVNSQNGIAVLIFGKLPGVIEQAITFGYYPCFWAEPGLILYVKFDCRRGVALRKVYALHINI